MREEENYFCSLSGSTPSKIPRYDYGMHNRDHFLLQTSAAHQQQQQHLRYEDQSPPQQQPQHHPRYDGQSPPQQQLQQHRQYESQSPQQQQQQQLLLQHRQRYEMLPQEIIHVPTGPIYFQENIDWKSNIVYQAPPPPPPLEQWNPNLTGKVDSILRTYLISLGQLQNKGLYCY